MQDRASSGCPPHSALPSGSLLPRHIRHGQLRCWPWKSRSTHPPPFPAHRHLPYIWTAPLQMQSLQLRLRLLLRHTFSSFPSFDCLIKSGANKVCFHTHLLRSTLTQSICNYLKLIHAHGIAWYSNAATTAPTTGPMMTTGAYPQLEPPLPLIGSTACAIRGPRSRAGLMA